MSEWARKNKNSLLIGVFTLVGLNALLYAHIERDHRSKNLLRIYFADVGQGDSQLLILPGGVKILVDGGPPNKRILEELGEILSPFERRIDLVANTHPQLDHFGGLVDVLERYKISAIIRADTEGTTRAYQEFEEQKKKEGIRDIMLSAGDKIKYKENVISVMHPPKAAVEKEINEMSLVLLVESKNIKTLLTGDIGEKTEKALVAGDTKGTLDDITILKAAHHGSKYSSSALFLKKTQPRIAIIQVGKNSYGHPTKETLSRLGETNAKIYRNDRDGAIAVITDGKTMKIYARKQNRRKSLSSSLRGDNPLP